MDHVEEKSISMILFNFLAVLVLIKLTLYFMENWAGGTNAMQIPYLDSSIAVTIALLFTRFAYVIIKDQYYSRKELHRRQPQEKMPAFKPYTRSRFNTVVQPSKNKPDSASVLPFDRMNEKNTKVQYKPTPSIANIQKTRTHCAKCGTLVSENVRIFCLERTHKFNGKVYCLSHQYK